MTISFSALQIAASNKGKPWSDADIAILRDMRSARHSAPTIALRLGRTISAVYAEAKKAGSVVMARKTWTQDEVEQLRKLYFDGNSEALIAEEMDRTPSSVRAKVEQLDLNASSRSSNGKMDRRRMVTVRRHVVHARRVHVPGENGSWTIAQMDELVAMSGTVTLKDASERIGRPLSGVRAKAKQLGVVFLVPGRDRSERDAKLIEIWKGHEAQSNRGRSLATWQIDAIAQELGVSRSTVIARARELGLRKARNRRRFDEVARAEIKRLAPTMTVNGVARATGWDLRTVRRVGEEEELVFAAPAPRPAKLKKAVERKAAARVRKSKPNRTNEPVAVRAQVAAKVRKPVPAPVVERIPVMESNTALPAPALAKDNARERRDKVNRVAKARVDASSRSAGREKYVPEVNRGSEQRLQTIYEVYRKMKKKGYFPKRTGHVEG